MKVSNLLTIIAIFAGVAEVFASGSLVLLPLEIQTIFVYFVMAFPLIIIAAFFGILVMKPHVLYAPSDFANEENFVAANGIGKALSAKVDEVVESVKRESPGLSNTALDTIRKNLKHSVKFIAEESYEQMVLDYLKSHPSNGYTTSAISDLLSLNLQSVIGILTKLENDGMVVRTTGKNAYITLWKIKI
ncbi:ArsR family transcriptional regulator [Aliivibrio fischeri]|uniref:Uncharacterized protein n=1 Tax=Aliivibrio fischeri TaxID=668 RepID=A0A510UNF8_ALIFS|nr:ArsR family transcriptional regulator [Aliivibrio fischeri]GEK16187.1 hypothetical protein AFI02nite_42230 [Aliivibrio fischeri]